MFKDFIESSIGFKSSGVDPGMYYWRNAQADGSEHYKLLLVYVDDVLAVSHDPEKTMKEIGMRFEIKNNKNGPPIMYLGGDIEKFQLPDGSSTWSMTSCLYVNAAVETIRALLAKDGHNLRSGK